MAFLNVTTDFAGQIGVRPRLVRIKTNNTFAEVTAQNFLQNLITQGYEFFPDDEVVLSYGTNSDTTELFSVLLSGANITLVRTIVYNTSVNGQVISTTINSATPGTVRALTGKLTNTATTMTSGNMVGVRGEVDCGGASGGFIYGTQGKVIPTSSFSGGPWIAGVFGQFDFSNAGMLSNTAQYATLWGDFGATAHAGTYAGMRGIAMTNTTAAILNAQIYLYGAATNLLELNDNNGLSGATYFVNAGTGSGSAGNSTHCAAQKVMTCTFNGSSVYIPVFTQNS